MKHYEKVCLLDELFICNYGVEAIKIKKVNIY